MRIDINLLLEEIKQGVVHNAKEASKTFKGIAEAMAEQWVVLMKEIKENK